MLSPGQLAATFRQLWTLRGDVAIPVDMPQAANPPERLLLELLALPESREPLRWLLEERADAIARIALKHLLDESRPALESGVGRVVERHSLRQSLQAPAGVRVVVRELTFGTEGFTVTADVRIFEPGLGPPRERGWITSDIWPGFDRVVDDQGHHYLVRYAERSAGGHLRWWTRESLAMAFFPSVASSASDLTFTASPMTLGVLMSRIGGHLRLLPDRDIGDLNWRVAAPRSRFAQ